MNRDAFQAEFLCALCVLCASALSFALADASDAELAEPQYTRRLVMARKARKSVAAKRSRSKPEIVVVGAGAFGGWTALHLLRMGARVTLVDAFGAGDLRAASSGETRVIRAGYGHKPIYAEWTARALKLWKQFEREWHTALFVPSGVLWLCPEEDDYARASLTTLGRLRIPFERLTRAAIEQRFPQISTEGVNFAWLEPKAGLLFARVATQAVAAAVAREGGRVIAGAVTPPQILGSLKEVQVADGESIQAERFVFACGSWMPKLFPDLLARRIFVTRQEVFFFGAPPGDERFTTAHMPVWLDPALGFYGLPSAGGRGVKVADDRSGPLFDPSTAERAASAEGLREARAYLAHRIPALAAAPMIETRVCQYGRTPDAHLVLDRHPAAENVWLVGGDSGHGFKLGPALGEFLARHVLGRAASPILPQMRLGACEWPADTARPATRSL